MKQTRVENKLCHKKWGNNASSIAKVMVILELITMIANKSKHISDGKITIGHNHEKSHNKIVNEVKKISDYVQEAGVEMSIIKRELKNRKDQLPKK